MSYENIPLPRIITEDQYGTLHYQMVRPLSVSVELSIIPLSTVTVELPEYEVIPVRSYVEIFTSMGSVGVFRARSPENEYGEGVTTVDLEHAIVELGDWIVKESLSAMMTPADGIARLFTHYSGSKWQLGSTSCFSANTVAVEADYGVSVLEAIIGILEQVPDCYMTFNFATKPWTLNFTAKSNVVEAEGRLTRNVNGATVTYDDSELCTRVYYEQNGTYSHIDADANTLAAYGIVEKLVSVDQGATAQQAATIAQSYLDYHKAPSLSLEIDAEDLSGITGEPIDTFAIGKKFRLVIKVQEDLERAVEVYESFERHVSGLSWPDVYGTPRNIIVTLDAPPERVIKYIN